MKVLVVALYDDNFGDMLIRTNCTQLLKIVLHDLDVQNYEIDSMHLRDVCRERIESADLILFAGGALFGLSYQHFHDHLFEILDSAEECNVPVVFSSLGANNMNGDEEGEKRLSETLHKRCVKAISVRDNLEFFRRYTEGTDLKVHVACDPAVWTRHTYCKDIESIRRETGPHTPVIGINVVRGALFKANGVDWNLKQENKYLRLFSSLLEQEGFDYRFFTNGSVTDNNALLRFAEKNEIPPEKVILPATTRELVQAVTQFDIVAAIRMHASIVSYALGIPSFNLVWNNKIRHFYKNIGCPDRAIELEDWTCEALLQRIRDIVSTERSEAYPSPEYMMSVYHFLYGTLRQLTDVHNASEPMDFETICRMLEEIQIPEEEDILDLRVKVAKSEKHYLKLWDSSATQKKELKTLKRENQALEEKNQILRSEKEQLKTELAEIKKTKVYRIYHKLVK